MASCISGSWGDGFQGKIDIEGPQLRCGNVTVDAFPPFTVFQIIILVLLFASMERPFGQSGDLSFQGGDHTPAPFQFFPEHAVDQQIFIDLGNRGLGPFFEDRCGLRLFCRTGYP